MYGETQNAWEIERLKRRIAEGRIEVAAMFLNMSEIATEASLAASLQPLRELRQQHPTLEITVSTGNTSDIVKAILFRKLRLIFSRESPFFATVGKSLDFFKLINDPGCTRVTKL